MTVVIDIAEPQRQTFLRFLKTLPYVTVVSEARPDDSVEWHQQTAQQFMDGYADSDDVYDEL